MISLGCLLLLAVVPAAARAEDGLATIRVEQQGPGDETVGDGCWKASNLDDYREACDDKDGVVVLDQLPPGDYDVHEQSPPPGYRRAADFSVTLSEDEAATRARRHEPRRG